MAKEKKKKNEKKVEKKTVKKESFLRGIKKELKLVKWPTFKEIFKYTLATVLFCLFLVGFFMLVSAIMAYVTEVFKG